MDGTKNNTSPEERQTYILCTGNNKRINIPMIIILHQIFGICRHLGWSIVFSDNIFKRGIDCSLLHVKYFMHIQEDNKFINISEMVLVRK